MPNGCNVPVPLKKWSGRDKQGLSKDKISFIHTKNRKDHYNDLSGD